MISKHSYRGISLNVDKIPPHLVDHICSFLSHYRKAVLAKLTLVRQSFAMNLFDFNFYSVIKGRTMCLTTNKDILKNGLMMFIAANYVDLNNCVW